VMTSIAISIVRYDILKRGEKLPEKSINLT
jgi:hypothetical protein